MIIGPFLFFSGAFCFAMMENSHHNVQQNKKEILHFLILLQ